MRSSKKAQIETNKEVLEYIKIMSTHFHMP